MPKRSRALVGSTYYNQSYFSNKNVYMINSIIATTLALFEYFENTLFNVDTDPVKSSRIVYAKNEYAFRARLQDLKAEEANSDLQINTLNMPFMNFGISSISLSDQRLMSTHTLATQGVYIPELGKKLRLFPVTIEYEGCFFTTQAADAQWVLAKLYKEASSETLIKPILYYADKELANFGSLNYTDITYDGQYSESDWLEQNRIHTTAFNFTVDTYFVDSDPGIDVTEPSKYALVKNLYLKYATRANIDGWPRNENDYDGILHAVVDHINQTVIWDFNK